MPDSAEMPAPVRMTMFVISRTPPLCPAQGTKERRGAAGAGRADRIRAERRYLVPVAGVSTLMFTSVLPPPKTPLR